MKDQDFTNAKVGETVILYTGHNSIVAEIDRTTPTQVHAEGKSGGGCYSGMFRKKDGYQVGASVRHAMSIHYPESGEIQEIQDERERNSLYRELDAVSWRNLPLTTLRAVKAAMDSEKTQPAIA